MKYFNFFRITLCACLMVGCSPIQTPKEEVSVVDTSAFNDSVNITFNNIPDTMKVYNLEASKQFLKDCRIKFEKRYEGVSDKGPYFENDNDRADATVAFVNLLADYFYSHGYKAIDEKSFVKRVSHFFYEDDQEFQSGAIEANDSLKYDPRFRSGYQGDISSKLCVYLHGDIWGHQVEIVGAQMLNDGYDDVYGEPINERMDMESFQNGELVLSKKDYGDYSLEKVLNEHLFLYNDNKAAKNWLLKNYIDFFFTCIYRYDDDEEINRAKLKYMLGKCVKKDGILSITEAGGSATLYAGLNGRQHKMMQTIFDETDKKMMQYETEQMQDYSYQDAFEMLLDYFCYVKKMEYWKLPTYNRRLEDLCLFAKMEVTLNKKHCSESHTYGWFNNVDDFSMAYQCLDDSLLEIAKQHDYYDIPDFEEVLKVYDWDYNHDTGEKDRIPFDYTTLLP